MGTAGKASSKTGKIVRELETFRPKVIKKVPGRPGVQINEVSKGKWVAHVAGNALHEAPMSKRKALKHVMKNKEQVLIVKTAIMVKLMIKDGN